MLHSTINIEAIEKLRDLVQQRDAIQSNIDQIIQSLATSAGNVPDSELPSHENNSRSKKSEEKPAAKPASRKQKTRKRQKKGASDIIFSEIQNSGETGISIKKLAKSLKMKTPNISSTIFALNKKHNGIIERVSTGVYRIKASKKSQATVQLQQNTESETPAESAKQENEKKQPFYPLQEVSKIQRESTPTTPKITPALS